VRASLPGLTSADVTVEARPGGEGEAPTLLIHARPRLFERYELPAEADVVHIRASLLHGELTVAVPRARGPAPFQVPIVEGELPHEQLSDAIEVYVPGLGAADLSLTADEDTFDGRALKLEGRRGGSETVTLRRYLPLPSGVALQRVTAAVAHGLLRVHFPRELPRTLVVDDSRSSSDEPAEGETVLARVPCPGVSAQQLALELDEQRRVLSVKVSEEEEKDDGGHPRERVFRRRFFGSSRVSVGVPAGVPLAGLRAVARDGLLTIISPARVASSPPEVAIPLDTAAHARLPTQEHEEAEEEEAHRDEPAGSSPKAGKGGKNGDEADWEMAEPANVEEHAQ